MLIIFTKYSTPHCPNITLTFLSVDIPSNNQFPYLKYNNITIHSLHEFTDGTFRTKAAEVVHAQDTPDVSVAALGSMATKTSVVPRAILHFHVGIDV